MAPILKVGEKVLPGQGEYEISGVEIEGLAEGVFFIKTEELNLLYLDRFKRSLSDAELDTVNTADILFLPVGGDQTDVEGLTVLTPEQAVKVINQVDPRIVIPMYYSSLESFRATEGRPLELLKELKVTKVSLPTEERQVIALEV